MNKDRLVWTLGESVDTAIDTFKVFSKDAPDLVETGIAPVDRVMGGLFPGSCGIVAAATGVGKSSLMLSAALSSRTPVGIVSCEDTQDVLGSRILSYFSGVNSLKFRTNTLTEKDKKDLEKARKRVGSLSNVLVSYQVASPMEDVVEATKALAGAGARVVWLDYIQKIKGPSDNRTTEVSRNMSKFHNTCFKEDVVGMILSQFHRAADPTRPPNRHMLKESGDLENEARLIVLGHKDAKQEDVLRFRLDKCSYGGEGISFAYRRDPSGILREVVRDSHVPEQLKKSNGIELNF